MWWLEGGRQGGRRLRRLAGPVVAIGLAALVGGCFQPMYGDRSVSASPAVRDALLGVEVAQIDAAPGTPLSRLAVEVRNELTFGLNGGGASAPPTHRLVVVMSTGTGSIIVDPTSARPEFEIVSLDANFRLMEIGSGKQVLAASATARVSYDIPGQQQRLAALRGQRDAQSRAAVVIAQQIRSRLASFFANPPS
ncbi:MAG: hypothetical protein J0H62_01625 [Rhizobiales bacterium]|nr:hypothetical protein [Hyphomicrobiales bacterium]